LNGYQGANWLYNKGSPFELRRHLAAGERDAEA
jgi:hypothetical protein